MNLPSVAAVTYAVIALLVVRPVAGHVAWTISDSCPSQQRPDGFDWTVGSVCGVFWLALVVWTAAPFLVRRLSGTFPAIGAERRAQKRFAEARTRDLEPDLGIEK